MALSDILEAMEAEADAELAQIARQEREGVAQIRESAGREIEALNEYRRQAGLAPLQRARARRLNRARQAAQAAAGRARDGLLREAFTVARSWLAELRANATYPAILRALALEALAQIEGDAVLHGDPRDEALLRVVGAGRLRLDLTTLGGVEAHSPDGRIIVDNTLEARLSKSEPLLRHEIMQIFQIADSALVQSEI
jgi:vacuolar-type H+-ATPase subunit E/Vma4